MVKRHLQEFLLEEKIDYNRLLKLFITLLNIYFKKLL